MWDKCLGKLFVKETNVLVSRQALCQRETNVLVSSNAFTILASSLSKRTNVLVSVDVEANPLSHSTNIQNVIAA